MLAATTVISKVLHWEKRGGNCENKPGSTDDPEPRWTLKTTNVTRGVSSQDWKSVHLPYVVTEDWEFWCSRYPELRLESLSGYLGFTPHFRKLRCGRETCFLSPFFLFSASLFWDSSKFPQVPATWQHDAVKFSRRMTAHRSKKRLICCAVIEDAVICHPL